MNDISPPGYSSAPAVVLLNLAPPTDSTTFQLGHLGYGPAFVAGEVQVKYAGSDAAARPAFSRLEVTFRGIERNSPGGEGIELSEQRKVLWGEGAAGSSSSAAVHEDFPPISTPFKLELTPDLPACLHLGSSSLEYSLVASVFYADPSIPPLVRCSPVHLARTSPPGSLLTGSSLSLSSNSAFSAAPHSISSTTPTPFSVRLPRTVFRRSEPIELITRIEVPDAKAVGEGLRLRTVSAELIRAIKVAGEESGPPRRDLREDDEIEEVIEQPQSVGPLVQRTVLAHSGKSARFSPTRPIVIKLVLHPPVEVSCQSITQSTILHSVTFSVLVTLGLINTSAASSSTSSLSLDATLSQEILIVPDLPSSSRSDKQKEVDRAAAEAQAEAAIASSSAAAEAWMPVDGPVPTYFADSQQDPGEAAPAPLLPAASGSSSGLDLNEQEQLRRNLTSSPVPLTFGQYEEEFDGYEELTLPATLSTRLPPPAIDEDVSPPSAGDPSRSLSLELAAAQGMDIGDAFDRDEEDETPPPNDFSPRDEVEDNPLHSPPPPSFLSHDGPPPSRAGDDAVPAAPPPHVDFPPLPSLSTYLPSTPPAAGPSIPAPSASPPPPASLAGKQLYPPPSLPSASASGPAGEEGLPPPYFGFAQPLLPPPPPSLPLPFPPVPAFGSTPSSRASSADRSATGRDERRYDPSFGSRGRNGSAGSAPADEAEVVGDADGAGSAEGDDEEGARPPPYE
ncbi:hypothetical protein JCM8547_001247 [Rhodosporidiobolus lusitaniae]